MSEFSGRSDKVEVIAIGGSAGSVEVILSLESAFEEFRIPVIVVVHRMRNEVSRLNEILDYRFKIPVREADHQDVLDPGTIYVAPPNYHLLVEEDRTLSLVDMELVKHSRPSIDVTFGSVAEVYGSAATGILLSGANDDGVDGLIAMQQRGGKAIAQDPETAEVSIMPESAMERVTGCDVMTPEAICQYLESLREDNW